jgi:hypothetical protein
MKRWIDAFRTPVSGSLGVGGDRQLEQVDHRLRVLPNRAGLDHLRLDRLVVRVVLPLLDLARDV